MPLNINPAQPHTLYPARDSLNQVLEEGKSQLPISDANRLHALLMTYHNTLLRLLGSQSVVWLKNPGNAYEYPDILKPDDQICVKYRDGTLDVGNPDEFFWPQKNSSADIVEYIVLVKASL